MIDNKDEGIGRFNSGIYLSQLVSVKDVPPVDPALDTPDSEYIIQDADKSSVFLEVIDENVVYSGSLVHLPLGKFSHVLWCGVK